MKSRLTAEMRGKTLERTSQGPQLYCLPEHSLLYGNNDWSPPWQWRRVGSRQRFSSSPYIPENKLRFTNTRALFSPTTMSSMPTDVLWGDRTKKRPALKAFPSTQFFMWTLIPKGFLLVFALLQKEVKSHKQRRAFYDRKLIQNPAV